MNMRVIDSDFPDPVHGGMTPRTCRAARVLLRMDQIDLAKRAKINVQTLRNYEGEQANPNHRTWLAIKRALELAGVIFIDDNGFGPGVRLRRPDPR